MANEYCTIEDLTSRGLVIAESDESTLLAMIEGVSREIDAFCGRVFFASAEGEERVFEVEPRIAIDDLLAADAVALEDGTDLIEGEDFHFEPRNKSPKTVLVFDARNSAKTLTITGDWGFSVDVPAEVRECAIALSRNSWNERGGTENSQERFDTFTQTRAGEKARAETMQRFVGHLRKS